MDLRLHLELESAEPIRYVGRVELPDGVCAVVVDVHEDPRAADGLASDARLEGLEDDSLRGQIERLGAAMVRKAVRGAHKDGLPPPRRIRRWRSVQG